MKTKYIVILSIVVVLIGAIVIGAFVILNSPEWTLKKLQDDIATKGISSLRGYLTENLQKSYDDVESAYYTAKNVASGIGKVTEGLSSLFGMDNPVSDSKINELIDQFRDEAKTFRIIQNKFVHRGNTTYVSLDFTVSIFNTSALLTMVRRDGRWLISELYLPDLDWTLE